MKTFAAGLNQYTWYSRLAALALFVGAVPALAFYTGVEYQQTLDALADETPAYVFPAAHHAPVATSTGPAALTSADDGQVVHVAKGALLALKLGAGYDWKISVSDASVLAKAATATPAGAQALYVGKSPGFADLAATGKPQCPKTEKGACAGAAQTFTAYVIVQ